MKKSLQYEPFDDIHSPIDARLGMQYIQGRNVVYGRKEGFIKGNYFVFFLIKNIFPSIHPFTPIVILSKMLNFG